MRNWIQWTKEEIEILKFYNKLRLRNGWSKYRTIINVRLKFLNKGFDRSYTSIYSKFMKLFPN